MGKKPIHFFILITMLVVGGLYVNALAKRDDAYVGKIILEQFPKRVGNWQGVDVAIGDDALKILKADAVLFRQYTNPAGEMISFYASYHRSQKEGQLIHSPKNCYPGAGWEILEDEITELTLSQGVKLPVNKLVVSRGPTRQLVLYWYQSPGTIVASDYAQRLYMIKDSITKGRTDGSLVRVSTAVGENNVEETFEKEKQFLELFYPKLLEYLPQ